MSSLRQLKPYEPLAGLNEQFTPHSLRHTHTSLLAEAGIGLHEIMERLGHKDGDTTKNMYMHATKTKKKKLLKVRSTNEQLLILLPSVIEV